MDILWHHKIIKLGITWSSIPVVLRWYLRMPLVLLWLYWAFTPNLACSP